ncbi:MAG: hypothetical protein ABSE53_06390 [Terracidiphilus sp.]|jgi:hypothetical protein
MKNPICAASYERAVKLMAADCYINHLDALPHQSAAMCEPFRVELPPGFTGSRVFVRGRLDPIYVIPARFVTERPSGMVVSDWGLELPWPDSSIIWDHLPWDVIPPKYHNEYGSLFESELMDVLNEHHRIRCGQPVDGLLCATSFRPIEESCHSVISAKLSCTDDLGNTVSRGIDFNIERLSRSSTNRLPVGRADGLLRRHLVDSRRWQRLEPEIQKMMLDEQVQAQMQSGLDAL